MWPFTRKEPQLGRSVVASITASNRQATRIKDLKRDTAQTRERAEHLRRTNHFAENLILAIGGPR